MHEAFNTPIVSKTGMLKKKHEKYKYLIEMRRKIDGEISADCGLVQQIFSFFLSFFMLNVL